MLTSGGDCQALNATMRGVAKTIYHTAPGTKIFGFEEGYRGLMYGHYTEMKPDDFTGLLTKGGTILGSSREPYKLMRVTGKNGFDKVEGMKRTYHQMRLDCLIILGGNGSQKTANLLREEGLNIIFLPKTIDNDIYGTDMSFGFQSAVDIATNAIDCIHTTADSHGRVFIVELMGHKTGWLTLYAGIGGGADIILIPEIPYDMDCVIKAILERNDSGKRFSILAVAEGAVSRDDAALTKKEYESRIAARTVPSVSYEIGEQIREALGREVRIVVPGHTQRGGSPDPYDRVISTRLGIAGGQMALDGRYGYMAAVRGNDIVEVPLGEVAGKLKYVDPESSVVQEARSMGISFGD